MCGQDDQKLRSGLIESSIIIPYLISSCEGNALAALSDYKEIVVTTFYFASWAIGFLIAL